MCGGGGGEWVSPGRLKVWVKPLVGLFEDVDVCSTTYVFYRPIGKKEDV